MRDVLSERHRFEVSCREPSWSVTVLGQISLLIPAVTAQTAIDRRQLIGAADLTVEPTPSGRLRQGFFHSPEEVIGTVAVRRLRLGQLVTPNLVEAAPAVRAGQRVRIVASHGGIEASTFGEALADGNPGQVIQVRNVSSDKAIHAKVLEPGVVTSTF